MSKKLIDYSLEEYIEKAKDKSSIPGGGSICALCGALCGALGIMVERLSHGDEELSQETIESLTVRISQLKENIDRDAHSFNQVLEAMKLPKETESDCRVRANAMEAGYIHATEVPMSVIESTLESLKILHFIAARGSIYAITDASIAADLGLTSIRGAAMTARLNISQIKDKRLKLEMAEKIDSSLTEAVKLHQQIQREVEGKLIDK